MPAGDGAVEGTVVAARRAGAGQRLELAVPGGRLDVDVPADAPTAGGLAVLPRVWHLYDP